MSSAGQGEGDRAGPAAPSVTAPAPTAADVGIVAAMSMEVGCLIDRLHRVRKYQTAAMPVIEGELRGKIVAIAIGGMGREAARRATGLLVDGHRPSWVLSAGYAGALHPDRRRNDLVLPDEVVDLEGRRIPIEIPEPVRREATPLGGRLLTVDRIIFGSAEKRELRQATGADLVDMETSAVAEVCAQRLTRFLSLRVVSDDAQTELPREIAAIMTKSGSYRVGAALRALWNRPASLKDFWMLHEHALEAADRLAGCVERCLGEWLG